MFTSDVIVVMLSVLVVIIVPSIRELLKNYKSSIFNDVKQLVLDYYSSLDTNIDHLSESNRNLKETLQHFKEIQDLKLSGIENRLDKLEKIIE